MIRLAGRMLRQRKENQIDQQIVADPQNFEKKTDMHKSKLELVKRQNQVKRASKEIES